MSGLLDRAQANIEAWVPEPGDKLEGVVSRTFEVDTDFGTRVAAVEVINVSTITHEGGKAWDLAKDKIDGVQVIGFHTVLNSQLRQAKVQVGDRIAVVRQADKPNKQQGFNPIKMYRVVTENTDADSARPPRRELRQDEVPF